MNKKNKASEDSLGELHALTAEYFKERLRSGEVTPSELSATVKFLKDNNITVDGSESSDLLELVDDLPFSDAMIEIPTQNPSQKLLNH